MSIVSEKTNKVRQTNKLGLVIAEHQQKQERHWTADFAREILVEKSYFTFILIQATQLQPWGSALCCSEIISTLLISLKHSLCWGAHIQCSDVHSKTSKRTDPPTPHSTPSYIQQQSAHSVYRKQWDIVFCPFPASSSRPFTSGLSNHHHGFFLVGLKYAQIGKRRKSWYRRLSLGFVYLYSYCRMVVLIL